MKLRKSSLCFQVTALAFLNDRFIIAGVGPFIRVFDAVYGSICLEKAILSNARIHGFEVCKLSNESEFEVLVLGGKTLLCIRIDLAALLCSNHTNSLRTVFSVSFRDWAWSASWITNDSVRC